jgi:hypothetical protein
MATRIDDNLDPNQFLHTPIVKEIDSDSTLEQVLNEDDRLLAEMGYKQ